MNIKRKPEAEAPKEEAEPRPKPLVTTFGLVKKEKNWHALAIRIRGREVMEERILESSEWLEVSESVAERALYDFTHHGLDPFKVP